MVLQYGLLPSNPGQLIQSRCREGETMTAHLDFGFGAEVQNAGDERQNPATNVSKCSAGDDTEMILGWSEMNLLFAASEFVKWARIWVSAFAMCKERCQIVFKKT
ncbi:hypothetical protein Adt_41492 [Abeliophyllum distichum]|uniref:Uncharacterized protein n=1 Tax=Abeliophyllum distichum TaxID=126358 RepID=A0ABD1PSW5_9LAMI